MYSTVFLPTKTYTYLQLRVVNLEGVEQEFINRRYGLFHGEQPLLESVRRNRRIKSNTKHILAGILNRINRPTKKFSEIRLYEVNYDWAAYKNAVLNNEFSGSANFKNWVLLERMNE